MTSIPLVNAIDLTDDQLASLSPDQLSSLITEASHFLESDRQYRQIFYYRPVSNIARAVHMDLAKTIALFGGNGSSKTDTILAELTIMMTGLIPMHLKDFPREKIKCPGQYRIVVESLTTTLYPIILPKLQYWHWDGIDEQGGRRGHWGWIPRSFLINGDWSKSWSDKIRLLRLACGCTVQFMSHDQDPTDFASGSFHAVFHDELPSAAIWRENRARVMRAGGYLYLAMTPPDDAGIHVDWVHDEIYDRGQPGPNKNPHVSSFHLMTENNPHLDQAEVQIRAAQMTPQEREVRLHGRFVHMSNLVHPLFTDTSMVWCFSCNTRAIGSTGDQCPKCGSVAVIAYSHVEDITHKSSWPVVMLIDPHPRRPHAIAWIAISPSDESIQLAELEVDDEPIRVYEAVTRLENDLLLYPVKRLMDPNIGEQPASAEKRGVTWRKEFSNAGLRCDPAIESFITGKTRINDALKPDQRTKRPRMFMHPRCARSIYQFKRLTWDEWVRHPEDRNPKEKPRAKHGDFPALWRYFMNGNFSYDNMKYEGQILDTRGHGRGIGRGNTNDRAAFGG